MPGVTHVPFPYEYRPVLERRTGEDYGETVVRYLEEEVFKHNIPGDEVAAVLVKPIQNKNKYIIPPTNFFPTLHKLYNKYTLDLYN